MDRRAEFSSDSFCRRLPAAQCYSLKTGRVRSRQRAVIVAMIAMPMVQSAVGNVIEMVAVRRHRVTAAVMATVAGRRGASLRIHGGDFDGVFVVMTAVR
jgi:hypothetical protein